jgi:hypothetical protein
MIPAQAPGWGDRLSAGLQDFRAGGQNGGLVGGLMGGYNGLTTGQLSPMAALAQQPFARAQAPQQQAATALPNYDKPAAPLALVAPKSPIDLTSYYANLRRG